MEVSPLLLAIGKTFWPGAVPEAGLDVLPADARVGPQAQVARLPGIVGTAGGMWRTRLSGPGYDYLAAETLVHTPEGGLRPPIEWAA